MTHTNRNPHKYILEPNQVYIKRTGTIHPVQTLVEGSTEWSYCYWSYTGNVSLYFKGFFVTTLEPLEAGKWIEAKPETSHHCWKVDFPPHYTTLAHAADVYSQDQDALANFERWNKAEGLEGWCVRHSFTPTPVSIQLELPPDEYQRLVRLAKFDVSTLAEFVQKALYVHLASVEKLYTLQEQRKQKVVDASSERLKMK